MGAFSKHERCPQARKGTPTSKPAHKAWKTKTGIVVFVDDGIGTKWATFFRKPNGSLCRYVSKYLPLRNEHDLAQADLNCYAVQKGWQEVEITINP